MPRVLVETYAAVDPIAHLPRLDPLPIPTAPFDGKDGCSLEAPSRETDHFAIVGAAWIGASAWEVVEYLFRRNE